MDSAVGSIDDLLANDRKSTAENDWKPPTPSELRAAQREADRIIQLVVRTPAKPDTLTRRLDTVLLHPIVGLVILLCVLFVMFQAVFTWAQPLMNLISFGMDTLGASAHTALPAGLLQSFVENGVISGVGSVIVFLPQILIMFLFILILEDLGYMARAAFLMDRIMGGAGLHGRAFIPLLSSFACAIPGIMATRVIDNPRDRLTTILVALLITCSARIPVYTLIISAFIPAKQVWGFAVAALGTVYAVQGGKEAAQQIGQALAQQWSLATALSLLVWYILAPQCASTLAVIRRETGSWRWMVSPSRTC